MTNSTRARAIECQKWADHYASEAAIARQYAGAYDGCKYRARALHCQRMAQINAATARAILAD